MNLLSMVPVPTIVKVALGATDAQRADAARAAMSACATGAERAALVAKARAFLADLEASW